MDAGVTFQFVSPCALFEDSCCLFLFPCLCFHPFHHSPLCVSELKLQLQSSFELEDSSPEEQCTSPDTPLPDKLVVPADMQQKTPTNENPLTASPNYLMDLVVNTSCPLSEKLRDLRLETIG